MRYEGHSRSVGLYLPIAPVTVLFVKAIERVVTVDDDNNKKRDVRRMFDGRANLFFGS